MIKSSSSYCFEIFPLSNTLPLRTVFSDHLHKETHLYSSLPICSTIFRKIQLINSFDLEHEQELDQIPERHFQEFCHIYRSELIPLMAWRQNLVYQSINWLGDVLITLVLHDSWWLVRHVWKRREVCPMANGDLKRCFVIRLVETRENASGIRRFHLGPANPSKRFNHLLSMRKFIF